MCSEGNGKEECIKKNARCVEDSKVGFKCECSEAEEMDSDGICKSIFYYYYFLCNFIFKDLSLEMWFDNFC